VIKQHTEVVLIRFLGKLDGDWRGSVGDQVLEGASSHVVVKKYTEVVLIRLVEGRVQLEEGSSEGSTLVGDKVNEGALGDVFSIELSNHDSLSEGLLLSPGRGSVVTGKITIIVGESLVEGLGERLLSIIWVLGGSSGLLVWGSLDHHGDGDVVVVGWVLLLVSIVLSDGVEGVVTNDLSKGL